MSSKIGIINMALRRLGEQPINSLTEQSEAASIVSDIYDIALNKELRAWPYTFAVKVAELVLLESEEPPDFAYAFQLPADYLGFASVIEPTNTYIEGPYNNRFVGEWEIRGGLFLSNFSDVTIKYRFLQTDTSKWDASFVDAFAWKLAEELALPLTGTAVKATRAEKNYVLSVAQARGESGNESRSQSQLGSKYIRARR